jgi:hypothetical protein
VRRLSFIVILVLSACGRVTPLRTLEPEGATAVARHDAGATAPPSGCDVAFGGPDCCAGDGTGARVTSATCQAGSYVCSQGAVCSCHGQAQTFFCTDFCGSDAFVEPTCGAAGWLCPSGLIETSSCPKGTCWGEPGEGCLAVCRDGEWTCEPLDGGT